MVVAGVTKVNKTGTVIKWTLFPMDVLHTGAETHWTNKQMLAADTEWFLLCLALAVCEPARCILPPTVLACVHKQARSGTEQHYSMKADLVMHYPESRADSSFWWLGERYPVSAVNDTVASWTVVQLVWTKILEKSEGSDYLRPWTQLFEQVYCVVVPCDTSCHLSSLDGTTADPKRAS